MDSESVSRMLDVFVCCVVVTVSIKFLGNSFHNVKLPVCQT